MTARKRKSPDRKKPVKQPGILSNLLLAGARAAARRPKALFGCAAFGIVFSFVAANALWYQPGGHPSPFLATRDSQNPNQIAGYRPARRTAPADVTTFRIERADPNAVAPAPAAAPTAAPAQQTAAPVQSAPSVVAPIPRPQPQQAAAQPAAPHEAQPATPKPAETPRATPAAPTRPVQSAALPPKPVSPVRPAESARGEDPVAAAIRASERKPAMTPPANIPNAASNSGRPAATPVSQKPNAPSQPNTAGQPSDLVLQIQRGLSNIAYADVGVDGVAGAQTKAAIRRFQRHYRLPETGEPDELVLKKLKSIGAL
ncbi:peptidoglycan-binding domain-containing protein [Neorhizobium galegae]|uniref:peptidoglycan-binding domain-containing protein n=1 Tax=Neorhizobium galegae TaxID=399 RepID=UPI001287649E|nr:peptidoglycan-binding domain-containing protein [Neorhizobium galegae]KAA9386369.1 peptidoglycan-binding protein [Neorhizobium galegae]KAB1112777.1 peptidoglycan-binding protein [Neorhizobium galegae]MCM2501366.1 peptidoglycan-binding protein [Neorhizobium galegae]MCQ1772178.1 peptidoglycan-binding protein [Neorhizobium galegae]MCQ1777642.1 peptidoglycan-binding protein [Neorhizobium galegae]